MSKAIEISTLGRLLETGSIKETAQNKDLIYRFQKAGWIKVSTRKKEWVIYKSNEILINDALTALDHEWRKNFQLLRENNYNPHRANSIARLPGLKNQKPLNGPINEKNYNAHFGIGPKNKSRTKQTIKPTRDWLIRFRPNKGLKGIFSSRCYNLSTLARIFSECILPESFWNKFESFVDDTTPKLIITVENLGPYIDLPVPDDYMVVYSPGADYKPVSCFLKALPDVKWFHFGDLDPDGWDIGKRLATESEKTLNFFIPSFAEDYLDRKMPLKNPRRKSWDVIPDIPVFHELKKTKALIFQEFFMRDERLKSELAELVKIVI